MIIALIAMTPDLHSTSSHIENIGFQVEKYIFRHLVEIIRINKHNLKTLIYPHLQLAQLRCDI